MFERVAESECKSDPCVQLMRSGTDESHKVIRKEGDIWHAVFQKRDPLVQAALIEKEVLEKFLD